MKLEIRRTTKSHKLTRTIVKDFSKLTKFQEGKTLKIAKETLKKKQKQQGQIKGKEN